MEWRFESSRPHFFLQDRQITRSSRSPVGIGDKTGTARVGPGKSKNPANQETSGFMEWKLWKSLPRCLKIIQSEDHSVWTGDGNGTTENGYLFPVLAISNFAFIAAIVNAFFFTE